jgi:hypothetical protein
MSVGVGKRSDIVRGVAVAVIAITTGARAPAATTLRPSTSGARIVSAVSLSASRGAGADCGALRAPAPDAARVRAAARVPATSDTFVRYSAPSAGGRRLARAASLAKNGFEIGNGEGTSPARRVREARTPDCRGEAP